MTETERRELRALAGDLREHAEEGVDLEAVALHVADELEKLAGETDENE